MTEMRIAALTAYLGAAHAVAKVIKEPDVLLFFRMGKARPAAMGFKLSIGGKERLTAGAADVGPVVLYT